MSEQPLRLSFPAEGLRVGELVLRLPEPGDLPELAPVFEDEELTEAGNMPRVRSDELAEQLAHVPALVASGRLAPLVVVDENEAILGGGTLHHLDAERGIIEIGYWLFPEAPWSRNRHDRRPGAGGACIQTGRPARSRLRQRRQPRLGASSRARRIHTRGRHPLDAEARWTPGRQDHLLVAARGVGGIRT